MRLGYSQFPSTNQAEGWNVGVEDVFVGQSGLTISGDYQASFNNRQEAWGTDLRYYVLPLGGYFNIAPVLGYRHLETSRYSTDGLNAGLRLLLVPSRTGAADISLTQSWVAPGSNDEVGLTTLSFGYALTHHLRLSTDLQNRTPASERIAGLASFWNGCFNNHLLDRSNSFELSIAFNKLSLKVLTSSRNQHEKTRQTRGS